MKKYGTKLKLAYYFYENKKPDYSFINKYFWYYSFHRDDLLSNTTHLWNHIDLLEKQKEGQDVPFDRFLIDKNSLRNASYSSRGRLSRAILSLFASRDPKDWENTSRSVLSDVYYILTDKPNLHHIFPSNYIEKNRGTNRYDSNSLMNIAYLTQITNLRISDKNPIDYLKDFDCEEFENVLVSYFVSSDILNWARMDEMPENALDIFINNRIENIISDLKQKLQDVNFEVIDTVESKDYNESLP